MFRKGKVQPMGNCRVEKDELFIRISDADNNTITVFVDALPMLIGELLKVLGVLLPIPDNYTMSTPDADIGALANLGTEWIKKPNKRARRRIHRIYFDPLHGWYGLMIQPDHSVALRGQPITELEATAIIARFREAKVYFDVPTRMFHGTRIGYEDFEFIVEQIRTLERQTDDRD